MKILLVSLYNDEAYGLRSLHSVLLSKGHDASIIFLKVHRKKNNEQELNVLTEKELELFVEFTKDYDLVAFSLVSSNFSLYKRIYPHINAKVLVGGWQPSLNPEKTIEYCDFLCVGEGEEVILDIADGKNPETIRNLWTKKTRNIVRPLIKDLDKLPNVRFDGDVSYIENDELIHSDPYLDNSRYGLMMSRGCPFTCTYCSNSYMKKLYSNWSKIRYRSSDHVLDELRTMKKNLPNVERVNFYDEVFTVKNMGFFERYKEEIDLPFYCMFYPGLCSEEDVVILKNAGLKGVWLGVQSGSEWVRKHIFKRHYTNETIKKQADIFHKHDISVRYDFIFDNPFETPEETEESIHLMKELPTPYSLNLFSLKFFPNTEITRMALDYDIITESSLNDCLLMDHQIYSISKSQIDDIQKRIGREGIHIQT